MIEHFSFPSRYDGCNTPTSYDGVPSNTPWVIRDSNPGIMETAANPVKGHTLSWRERSITTLCAAATLIAAVSGGAIAFGKFSGTETRIDPQIMREVGQLAPEDRKRFEEDEDRFARADRIIGTLAAFGMASVAAGMTVSSIRERDKA